MKMLKIAPFLLATFVACSAFAQVAITINTDASGDISGSASIVSANYVTISGNLTIGEGYEAANHQSWADDPGIEIDWTGQNLLGNLGSTTNTTGASNASLTWNGVTLAQNSTTWVSYTFAVPAGTTVEIFGSGYVSSQQFEGITFQGTITTASAIPEPSTYAAIIGVLALGGIGVRRMRRRKQVQQ